MNLQSFFLAAFFLHESLAVLHLEMYNVNPNTVTVSGLSSGACFATQFHVAHSASILGAATFAGVPNLCAEGVSFTGLMCMSTPALTPVDFLVSETERMASNDRIDPTSNLATSRVFVYHGTEDTVVDPDNYGPPCDTLGGEYINNCNYNGAYESLNYMLGGQLLKPNGTVALNGTFDEFYQTDFENKPASISMDDTGYIYIPSGCVDKLTMCRLHVEFHGCEQGKESMGDSYARNTGFLEVGELNNIIILFPQIIKSLLTPLNPYGCWDWWGYNGIMIGFEYASKEGPQIIVVKSMIDKLLYG